jgi:hypothetical protein
MFVQIKKNYKTNLSQAQNFAREEDLESLLLNRGAYEMISRRADSISNSSRHINETSQLVYTRGPELQGRVRDRFVKNRASSLARLQFVSWIELVQLVKLGSSISLMPMQFQSSNNYG